MRTTSVMIQNLCVPCACRCRYCLLSWDGHPAGISWEDSTAFAERFLAEARQSRPETDFSFTFGYAMEHPDLVNALRFLRKTGSPQADYLQCDGMKQRSRQECEELAAILKDEGVLALNFTFYGLPEYHDRFAARQGDYELMIRMARAAVQAGLSVSAGIPITKENIRQADELTAFLKTSGIDKIRLFIPHEEGRGIALASCRLEKQDLALLSMENRRLLNGKVYRTESEWLQEKDAVTETRRMIIISLRPDTLERYEKMSAEEIISEIEGLDEAYYAAFPSFSELARQYGSPDSTKLYRYRDLYAAYRRQYAREHSLSLYDVTDERQSGSRRS
ncbi:MAG: hypothetical protein IKD69_13915 [Solobacterium sp.]|nr:hypothetical protein [Solobacterium sp.]